ncbi:MAG: hypothetical protein ABR587_12605 [Candidatus Binatia bacterium]
MNILRVLAVLFGLLAVSNFLKPMEFSSDQGFVFMGRRLDGTPNLIAGWTFAIFLATYALALWRRSAAALPLGIAYAAYVSANLFLFTLRMPPPADSGQAAFGIAYTVVALGCAWGAVVVMVRSGFAEIDPAPGRIALRTFALLFALMALSNALKPFAYTEDVGFVLLGQRLAGAANTTAAVTFSALLATYAASIWSERQLALKLGIAYAAYVVVNLVMWSFRKPEGVETPMLYGILYLISAIGVSSGAAALLWKHRTRLA